MDLSCSFLLFKVWLLEYFKLRVGSHYIRHTDLGDSVPRDTYIHTYVRVYTDTHIYIYTHTDAYTYVCVCIP